MATHPGWPKRSPVIVTLSPVLPSSGETFLTLGPCVAQFWPFFMPEDSAAFAFVLCIPPPGCAIVGVYLLTWVPLLFLCFLASSAAEARLIWQAKASAVRRTIAALTNVVLVLIGHLLFVCKPILSFKVRIRKVRAS